MDEAREFTYYLTRARNLREDGRFPEAEEALKLAYGFAVPAKGEDVLVDKERQELDKARHTRFRSVEKELEALLKKKLEGLSDEDVARGEELLAELRGLETAENALRLRALDERWVGVKQRRKLMRLVAQTKAELEELWEKPSLMLPAYDEALAKAQRMAEEYPGEPAFQELLAEAKRRRKDAYDKEGFLTTQVLKDQWEELDREFQGLLDRGEQQGPWYDWVVEDGERKLKQQRLEPFDLAYSHFSELARQSMEQKADEYWQRAKSELVDSPQQARETIVEALQFKYIGDKKKKELEQYLADFITPAIRRREKARQLLQEAREKKQQPEEAWALVKEAIAEDSALPEREIEGARQEILPYLRRHLEKGLRAAKEKLDAGDFEEALEAARDVRDLAEEAPQLHGLVQRAEQVVGDCIREEDEFRYVRAECERIEALIEENPQAAEDALNELERRIADKPERFQRLLRPVQDKVRLHEDLRRLVLRMEGEFQATAPTAIADWQDQQAVEGTKKRLEKLLRECRAQSEHRGNPPQLEALHQRIESRLHFYKGREAWEVGAYPRAIEHFKQVTQDDQLLVQNFLDQAKDATGAQQALQQADNYVQVRKYKEALDALLPWRDKPSPLQADVIQRYHKIEGQWEATVIEQLERLVSDKQRPLLRQIERLIRLLDEEIHSPRAPEYKAKYLPMIYAELARGAIGLDKKLQYLDQALEHAVGDERQKLLWERRKVKKQLVFTDMEEAIRQSSAAEAHQKLVGLISEYPDDAEALVRMVEVCLVTGDTRLAESYLRQGRGAVDSARRENQPSLAGCEQMEELVEWDFHLKALEEKIRAVKEVHGVRGRCEEVLQPQRHISEYQRVRDEVQKLREELKRRASELFDTIKTETEQPSCPTQIRERVQDYWKEQLCQWLLYQAESLQKESERLERELIHGLREEMKAIPAPDVERCDFRRQSIAPEVKRRWEIGLKLLYLFPHSPQGQEALREVHTALSRLKGDMKRLTAESGGPVADEENNPLLPFEALEKQIVWMEKELDWITFVRGLLRDYNRAAGNEDTQALGDADEVYQKDKTFIEELYVLRSAIMAARQSLSATVAIGRGPRHWGEVNWREVAHCLLLSPQVPLPKSAEQDERLARQTEEEKRRTYWSDLEGRDAETRWERWREAAVAIERAALSENTGEAPWHAINACIQKVGIEERWDEIGSPLRDIMPPYRGHRAMADILRVIQDWQDKRNRIILMLAELYILVRAEEFGKALKKMEAIEGEDRDDAFGFRQHVAIGDPILNKSLSWEELKQALAQRQQQWDVLEKWWDVVRSSALTPWKSKKRDEVIELVRNAEFKTAYDLCWDALHGALGEGRTNALGGGLAFLLLKQHLQDCPVKAEEALSQQVSRRLQEAEQCLHDVEETVRDLQFWLMDVQEMDRLPPSRPPFPRPLKKLQEEYESYRDELERDLEQLRNMRPRFPGDRACPWDRRRKESWRRHCLMLLDEIRDELYAPALEKYRQWILEA